MHKQLALKRLQHAIDLILAGAEIEDTGHQDPRGAYSTTIVLRVSDECRERALFLGKYNRGIVGNG